jgi:hypothetical protein
MPRHRQPPPRARLLQHQLMLSPARLRSPPRSPTMRSASTHATTVSRCLRLIVVSKFV